MTLIFHIALHSTILLPLSQPLHPYITPQTHLMHPLRHFGLTFIHLSITEYVLSTVHPFPIPFLTTPDTTKTQPLYHVLCRVTITYNLDFYLLFLPSQLGFKFKETKATSCPYCVISPGFTIPIPGKNSLTF